MNYIKIFQDAKALSVSVGSIYFEDKLIQFVLDKFHKGENYTGQIASHQAVLKTEKFFTDQKYLSITSL